MRKMRKMVHVGLLTGCLLMAQAAASPCYAAGDSPWMVRVRALGIYPDDSSSQITTIGGEASVDSAVTLDLDISYFFTENIAAELTLTYAEHDVSAENTVLGNIDLGSLDLLPPTLTLQYHFMPKNAFRPYVGAGLSYVLIPDEDPGNVATAIDYDDGQIGFALQVGFDYFFTKNWCLNVDVKKVWVDVDVDVYALGTVVSTNVDVDPWLVGVGIGYRF
jgi:outer membrane protein